MVYFKPGEGEQDLPIGLGKEIERLFRQGEDRSSGVTVEGEPWLLVLLQTGKVGTASFLARLEKRLASRPSGSAPVVYALQEPNLKNDEEYRTDISSLGFQRLDLSLDQVRSVS